MTDTALDQANAQMSSVRDLAAALECDYDRLEELRDEKDDLESDLEGGSQENINALDQWLLDNAEELADLEAEAGECEDREAAETRIREDALCVDVRSGWGAPGSLEPEEFRIVLCTGGPHVQMVGELDDHNEPSRAWLEYQDWGTSMTERVNQPGDQDALLAYARCFYFGE